QVMIAFAQAGQYWWRKPLVLVDGKPLTAELAVLGRELQPGEKGVWLNSRGRTSGVVDLVPQSTRLGPSFKTQRAPLPLFVAATLEDCYKRAKLEKGCPDLVIWRDEPEQL